MPLFTLDELAAATDDRSRCGRRDAGLRLAAVGGANRARRRRQAREPHADRRVQSPWRARLYGSFAARRRKTQRRRHGDTRQSRPVGGARRRALRHSGGDRDPGRKFTREERGDGGLRRRTGHRRQGFRREPRGRRADPARARLSFRAVVSPRPGDGRRDLRAGIVRQPRRPRRGLCADRHGLRHQRPDHGARSSRRCAPRSSAWSRTTRRPTPCRSRPGMWCRPIRRRPSPTAWRAATPPPKPSTSSGKGAARIVRVSEDDIAEAIRIYYSTTHNLGRGRRRRAAGGPVAGKGPLRRQARRADPVRRQYRHAGLCAQVLRGETPAA